MIIVTTDFISGKEIETIQIVSASTVQTRHIGKDIGAGLRNLVGGEVKNYVEMMNSSRELVIQRMTEQAENLGADGIVGVRFMTAEVMEGAAEVMVYGTAVKFK